MEFAAGTPSQWLVTLHSGAVLELAADGYTEEGGFALFSIVADATPEEQSQVCILNWPPLSSGVVVLVAKIPMTEVAAIAGGGPWPKTEVG